jgi:hypothetical protein
MIQICIVFSGRELPYVTIQGLFSSLFVGVCFISCDFLTTKHASQAQCDGLHVQ